MRMSTSGSDLTSLAPAHYTTRSKHGRVPDTVTLLYAALLISQDPAGRGRSHADVYAWLIFTFWLGEFERDFKKIKHRRRSAVFTLEPPRIRAPSKPDQKIRDILASPPPGAWVGEGGRVFNEDAEDDEDEGARVRELRRRRMAWTRREVLDAFAPSGDLPIAPLPRSEDAAFQLLAEQPLSAWSDYARALIWDRLCITPRRLARWWVANQEGPLPAFLMCFSAEPAPELAKEQAPPTWRPDGPAAPRQHHRAGDMPSGQRSLVGHSGRSLSAA